MISVSNDRRSPASTSATLTVTTAILTLGLPAMLYAQNCALEDGTLVGDCTHTNAGTSVTMPTQPNVELERIPELGTDGFEISVDGDPVTEDGRILTSEAARSRIEATRRLQDLELAENQISVKFDGLDVQPRLDIQLIEEAEQGSRSVATFENSMNYPAYVVRGELRIIDLSDGRGQKTLSVIPFAPNNRVSIDIPDGENLIYVYRVYDERGRFDETGAGRLTDLARSGADVDAELGLDSTERRQIPVHGGSITVSGTRVSRAVTTLGETVQPDAQGDFVLQRILPSGTYDVSVAVQNGPTLDRQLEIPERDLFSIGLIDITLGKDTVDDLGDETGNSDDDWDTTGRLAFYVTGKIRNGYEITAAADTGFEEFSDILKNFDEKNPDSLLDRLDPDDAYPVYGDDSTSEITAPTSGKLFVRIERDGSHAMWGNFNSQISETEYLRNERTLYGAQGVYRSLLQTSQGESVIEAEIFAASPETLPQRDRFLGTGGSTYFLSFQDITRGSENLFVEVQDPTNGQIVERRALVYGVDYDINYVQGIVILSRPLSGTASDDDLIVSNPNGDFNQFLVANYEFTPTASDVDAYSFGGRVQGWLTDTFRVGVSAFDEDYGTTEQKAFGVDFLYRLTDRTYAEFEFAQTDGDGRSEDTSVDGGLTGDEVPGVSGKGEAYRLKAQVDFADIGASFDGLFGGYYEKRTDGFSTLSYSTAVDEELYGFYGEFEPSENLELRFNYDVYDSAAGDRREETGLELEFALSERTTVEVGAEHLDQDVSGDPSNSGDRTDLATRVTFAPLDDLELYAYGQTTTGSAGGLDDNDRLGVGAEAQINEKWRLSGEISDGSTGTGARLLAEFKQDDNASAYFGWSLDPTRDLGGSTLNGRDRGEYVVGARRKLNSDLTVFAENTYDLFGENRSLTSVYGADYDLNDFWTLTGGIEYGSVEDPATDTDFDRTAVSFGAAYRDEQLSASGRIEYILDEGEEDADNRDADTLAMTLTSRYKLSEQARLLFAAEYISSDNDSASVTDAEYREVTFGYAFRPIDNDRLNVLAKYTYLYDVTERDTSNTTASNFDETPRQKSNVLSLDASYDLNNHFTLGGKIGGRWSEQDNGAGWASNDAWLGVVNLRYHVVHNWDALVEVRQLTAEDLGTDTGFVAAGYRHMGNNVKLGLGYNFGRFSDDLTDVTYDDQGLFLNIVGKF